jgi:hypothetical protein
VVHGSPTASDFCGEINAKRITIMPEIINSKYFLTIPAWQKIRVKASGCPYGYS